MQSVQPLARSTKFEGLEIVRALAAMQVAWGHAVQHHLVTPLPGTSFFAEFGSFSVLAFFILSGAIITNSSAKYKSQPRVKAFLAFMGARLLRIMPIYYCALAMAVVVALALHMSIEPTQVLWHLGLLPTPPLDTDPALWSLPYEMAYYLTFGLALFWRPLIGVWTVASLCAALIIAPLWPAASGAAGLLLSMVAMSIAWLAGHWSAVLAPRLPPIPPSLGLVFALLALLVTRMAGSITLPLFTLCFCPLIISILQRTGPATRQYRVIRGAATAVIVALVWLTSASFLYSKIAVTLIGVGLTLVPLSWLELKGQAFRWAAGILVYVGSISYALYAVHTPIIFLVGSQKPWPDWLKFIAFVVLTLACAHLLERVLQVQINRVRTWLVKRPIRI